jgi:phosphatidylglycerol:prolipoprotein diacylglycerol transferase
MHPLIPYFAPLKVTLLGKAFYGFGFFVAAGIVLGFWFAVRKAARDGLDVNLIQRQFGWMVVAIVVGGHLGHLLMYEPQQLLADPMVVLRVGSGLSSFGGMAAWGLLAVWFWRREGRRARAANEARPAGTPELPVPNAWRYADATMYGFTVGWFFGRIGCFVAHDHPGRESNFWLAVPGMLNPNKLDTLADKVAWIERAKQFVPDLAGVDPNQIPAALWHQVATHDMGLYEAIWALAMFGWFAWLDRKPRPPGFFQGLVLVAYGPLRLGMDFFRHPGIDTRYLGFTPAQYLSIAMTALGVWILARRAR